ncbi:hypothetical protein PVK06_043064 [Gossypium arboreum]|uniref:Uncharacterized protein n=1 Tax=Gossypium arboreum TaxID=29729 RepID=A0ABR0MMQ5_GOSAR|nr:hypothetical protein PVK06_043064 [Gossypium arboreum]
MITTAEEDYVFQSRQKIRMRFNKHVMLADLKQKISTRIATRCGKHMLRLFYKFLISIDPFKFIEMELEDDNDLGTMIAIYCPSKMENPSPVEFSVEIAKPEPVLVVISSEHDIEYSSDPDLDDIPKDIDDEGSVEGEDLHPHSTGNMRSAIVIRDNPGVFMTNVDLDVTLAREFSEYPDIVLAHLLDEELEYEELFVGQQFDNKKDYLHAINQYSLKLSVIYKVTNLTIPGSILLTDMQARFKYKVSYKKAWWVKQMAMKQLYGDWDASYNELQGWITVIQEYVLRTITNLQTLPYKGPDSEIEMGKRVFH